MQYYYLEAAWVAFCFQWFLGKQLRFLCRNEEGALLSTSLQLAISFNLKINPLVKILA